MHNEHTGTDFRDTIGTVDAAGKRRWVYPKRPAGRYYRGRTSLSYLLLLVLFGLPWLRVGGEPLFLFDVLSRHFILFGLAFTPQDFHLFALFMITGIVFVILFTAVFGRLFCGWVCPQTIFMEMVFRKIEYWIEGDANAQKRLAKSDWTRDKVRKKVFKHGLFLLVAAAIAHTFLAYVIGTDRLLETVRQSPLEAPGGFLAIVVFIGVFYAVFAYLREQVCIAICPYGRLQGVMLDHDSINVIYDYERGEPRGKLSKGKPKRTACDSCAACRESGSACGDRMLENMEALLTAPAPPPKGDCIDCTLCVQVCPTGIDIRDGIQMECINCTACIDACDAVMDKIDRPRGLIRYDSESGVSRRQRHLWTPRVMAYSGAPAGPHCPQRLPARRADEPGRDPPARARPPLPDRGRRQHYQPLHLPGRQQDQPGTAAGVYAGGGQCGAGRLRGFRPRSAARTGHRGGPVHPLVGR